MRRPLLSILICSLRQRAKERAALLDSLFRQSHRLSGIEVLVYEDDGDVPSGRKRNALLASARGAYVAFVDDDDTVADCYCHELLEGCETDADVVTFDLERIGNDVPRQVQTFRLHARDFAAVENGRIMMSANHLCAWKRGIARQVGFVPWIGYNDDVFWYTPLLASGFAHSEHHVTRVLYTYHWASDTTVNQSDRVRQVTFDWARGGVDAFWYRGGIVISATGRGTIDTSPVRLWRDGLQRATKRVIDGSGQIQHVADSELTHLVTIKAR